MGNKLTSCILSPSSKLCRVVFITALSLPHPTDAIIYSIFSFISLFNQARRHNMDSYHFSSFFLCMITGFLVLIPPYFSTTLASAAAATPQHASEPGAIETGGKNYSKVCDAARFEALGLRKDDFAYCDSSLPYPARVKDLVGRMTLAEKILQLGDRAQGVGRIGLPKYGWWSEALHGIAVTGHATYFGDVVPAATSFPNVILAAASFNESLWKKIGQVAVHLTFCMLYFCTIAAKIDFIGCRLFPQKEEPCTT